MGFADAFFDVYVVLGAPSAPGMWMSDQWAKVSRSLDPHMSSPRGRALVRSFQSDLRSKRSVSFGRLGWDKKSHEKWTFPADGSLVGRLFESCEAWSPSGAVCEQEGDPPDCFVLLRNERALFADKLLKFDSVLVIAIRAGIPSSETVREAVSEIARSVPSVLLAYQRRPWSLPSHAGGAINDLAAFGLFKPGNSHERPLDCATFAGDWEQLPVS